MHITELHFKYWLQGIAHITVCYYDQTQIYTLPDHCCRFILLLYVREDNYYTSRYRSLK